MISGTWPGARIPLIGRKKNDSHNEPKIVYKNIVKETLHRVRNVP